MKAVKLLGVSLELGSEKVERVPLNVGYEVVRSTVDFEAVNVREGSATIASPWFVVSDAPIMLGSLS